MPDFEKKLGGIITVEQETYNERAATVREVDQKRAEAAIRYAQSPTKENYALHFRLYERQVDLMKYPLAIKVRFLSIPIPFGSAFFPTAWFVKV